MDLAERLDRYIASKSRKPEPFASETDAMRDQLTSGGMPENQAFDLALAMARERERARDVPEENILGGDMSRLFQQDPTLLERLKRLPGQTYGAGEALASLGSAAALSVPSMVQSIVTGDKDPLGMMKRQMYLPKTEEGIGALSAVSELIPEIPAMPQVQLQALQAIPTGAVAAQTQRGLRAAQPMLAEGAERILGSQGLLMQAAPSGPKIKFAKVTEESSPIKTYVDNSSGYPVFKISDGENVADFVDGTKGTQFIDNANFRLEVNGKWANFDENGKLTSYGKDKFTQPSDTELAKLQELAKHTANILQSTKPEEKIFIRFGKLPRGEKSKNFATGQLEKGVSVFPTEYNRLTGKYSFDENYGIVSDAHMGYVIAGERPYAVTGEVVGKGSDGEPVLRNVKKVGDLELSEDGFVLKKNDGGFVDRKQIEDAAKQMVNQHKQGGSVQSFQGGGLAKAAASAAKAGAKGAKDPKIPLSLPRAPARTKQELQKEAERVGHQIIGEHVTSGKPKETENLAGYSMKEYERLKQLQEGQGYTLEDINTYPEPKEMMFKAGDIFVGNPGDITLADKRLVELGGLPINAKLEGGPRYGQAFKKVPQSKRQWWASNFGPANAMQRKATALQEMYPESDILAAFMSMGRKGTDFAQHFADANLRAINSAISAGQLKPEGVEAFNKIIRDGYSKINQKTKEREYFTFPEFAGIENRVEAYDQMMKNPELRKFFNDRMKKSKTTSALEMPSGTDVEWAISEPALRGLELGLVGHSVGRLKPGAQLIEPVEHATYSHGIPGELIGKLPGHVPAKLALPDVSRFIEEKYRPAEFTPTIQKVFPHQVVDQQWQDEVGQYLQYLKRITGKKKGGLAQAKRLNQKAKQKLAKSDTVSGLSALRK
jgi:hypothetical protein